MKKRISILSLAVAIAMVMVSVTSAHATPAEDTRPMSDRSPYSSMEECLGAAETATSVMAPYTYGNMSTLVEGAHPAYSLNVYELNTYEPCERFLESNDEIYEEWKYFSTLAYNYAVIANNADTVQIENYYQALAKASLSQMVLWAAAPAIQADSGTVDGVVEFVDAIQEGWLDVTVVHEVSDIVLWQVLWMAETDSWLDEVDAYFDTFTGKKMRKMLKTLKLGGARTKIITGYLEVLDDSDVIFAKTSGHAAGKGLLVWLGQEVSKV